MTDNAFGWRAVALVILVAAVIASIPLGLVSYPPLQDLPNHLARIFVLNAPADSPIRGYYDVAWGPLPNLVTDVILLGLNQFLPLALASKLLLIALGIGWLAAPFVLHRVVYGRLSLTPVIASAFLYSRVMQMGFLNFLFGTVAAMFCLAGWIALQSSPPWRRALAGAAMTTFLFFCHLLALGLFVLAVVIWEFLPVRGIQRSSVRTRLAILAASLVPAALLVLVVPRDNDGGTLFNYFVATIWDYLGLKGHELAVFLEAGPFFGSVTFIFLVVLVAVTLLVSRGTGDKRLGAIGIAFLVLFLAVPFQVIGGSHADWRMLVPFVLVIAAWLPLTLGRRGSLILAGCVLAYLGLQVAYVSSLWSNGEQNYRTFETVLAEVPEHSRLYYLTVGMGDGALRGGTSVLHLSGFAVMERNSIVPSLFAFPSQQPIRVKPEFAERHAELASGQEKQLANIDWPVVRADFDYVMIAARRDPGPLDGLEPVARRGIFYLFRVVR